MFGKKENIAETGIQKTLEQMRDFSITTGYSFEGKPIRQYIAPVAAETMVGAIMGTAVIPALPTTPFSGALKDSGKAIDAGRYAVLGQMMDKAKEAGANALIGLDFKYVVVDKNGLLVMGLATAVAI